MSSVIITRLQKLRDAMKQRGIDAYVIPTSDPHISEYPAAFWKVREWMSGFNGSAGTLVVCLDGKAGLWTDSRYYLQAEIQLEGSGIALFKSGQPDTPSIPAFVKNALDAGSVVAFDALTYTIADADALTSALSAKGISVEQGVDLVSELWTDRPAAPAQAVFEMPVEVSGRSTYEKLEDLRAMMADAGADYTVVSALDEVAWLLNIRGTDVDYNPVTTAYAVVSNLPDGECVLYIDPKKLNSEVSERLKEEGVSLAHYSLLFTSLASVAPNSKVLLDTNRTNSAIRNALPSSCEIVHDISPVNHLKSVKNETEIEGFRNALLRDGVAMTQFFYWLEKALEAGEKVSELSAEAQLRCFRSQQQGYIMDSFRSISSYGAHGAIVHYSATEETDTLLGNDSLYLIDSGGQYLDGTTDITRTIALCAEPTKQMKDDFTRALKGTIGIAQCRFPAGIRGCLLDGFARKALWDAGLNYGHGTCHGIGHCLNVHEGPQSIRLEENPVVLKAGMVMSDEPALYREGQYGIRTENMILVCEDQLTEYGQFLAFETLTLCHIDSNLIAVELLSDGERAWINEYHKSVFEKLSPLLEAEVAEWLRDKTKEI